MRRDRTSLFVVTIVLLAVGIVMVYSASAIYAYENLGDSTYFIKRHLLYIFIGLVTSICVMALDYNDLRIYTKPALIVAGILLIAVLIPSLGREVGGARRWFKFWIFSFQPSEFAKLVLIMYMADVLSRKQPKIKSFFHGFMPPMLILGFYVSLILLQPDLGTAIAIIAVVFIMFFVSGIKMFHILPAVISSLPVLAVLIISKPYRIKRILAFINPWADPKGVGFQIIQSFIALGSGGLFGVGLGRSRQKLLYLPSSHTDFIFSVVGEELGFIGAGAILALFAFLIWLGFKIAVKAPNLFGQLLALGIVSIIAVEVIVNVGVVTGTIPTKGLPLPFISYGGSSLIFNMIGVALLLNVAKSKPKI